ncbi:phosphoglycerate mutase-like protein [Pholiota conissans]|uniref:Phosphoglycerate mutase-like protein n=1 Tax=Pholiota conissans TaxID=109636 RepID=A0A9P5ZD53_9AGAR|nr:phosphoglycerate mutase-like protein [Pholiota conissans]
MTSVPPVANSKILGAVILIRHGDREGFFQDPITYTASNTAITPLGNAQSIQLGAQIRSIYFDDNSSPYFISTVNNTIAQDNQLMIRADAGGERGVIFNSAVSFLQGLFPATTTYSTRLANGSTIVGPLGGYQTIPIESVEPDNDISLEGWTDCATFTTATSNFYNSSIFLKTAADHADFLKVLPPFLDGRDATLVNMWNIFDYMNVNNIHNRTFAQALPPTFLAQARALADFHENGVFSSPQPNGIGNIAGQTILPSILSAISNITMVSSPLKFAVEAISYKPFISLFNMTGVAQMNPQLSGVVDYSSAAVFEVWQPNSGGEPVIRFAFKNGTADEFHAFNFLNSTTNVPVSTFVNAMKPFAFNDIPHWCQVCQNTQDRGCAALAAASASSAANATHSVFIGSHDRVSPVGAGFIGAAVMLVVLLGSLGLLSFAGFLTFGKQRNPNRRLGSDTDSTEKQGYAVF